MDAAARLSAAHGASASHGEEVEEQMNPIHTPYGVAPAEVLEPPNVQAQLRALCGDIALIEAEQARLAADSAHQGAEIGIALAELGALRRSVAELRREVCALRRRVAYRRRGALR
jgi:hypothetical protein